MGVEVTIEKAVVKLLPSDLRKRRLKQLAKSILELLDQSHRELSLLFTDDFTIEELNSSYRNKRKPTDVLSFGMPEGSQGEFLGDIVISVETAIKQADRFGVSLEAEFLRLLIHGTLHLLGYEHEKVPSHVARKMRKKEAEIFALF